MVVDISASDAGQRIHTGLYHIASQLAAVAFYLATGREDSDYTSVKAGPSKLMLILGDRESTATSVKVTGGTETPVAVSWRATFLR